MKWIRTCQSCGKKAIYPAPNYKTESYRDTKCKVCKSPGLDYGREAKPEEMKS